MFIFSSSLQVTYIYWYPILSKKRRYARTLYKVGQINLDFLCVRAHFIKTGCPRWGDAREEERIARIGHGDLNFTWGSYTVMYTAFLLPAVQAVSGGAGGGGGFQSIIYCVVGYYSVPYWQVRWECEAGGARGWPGMCRGLCVTSFWPLCDLWPLLTAAVRLNTLHSGLGKEIIHTNSFLEVFFCCTISDRED
jgi:hypothetical protein